MCARASRAPSGTIDLGPGEIEGYVRVHLGKARRLSRPRVARMEDVEPEPRVLHEQRGKEPYPRTVRVVVRERLVAGVDDDREAVRFRSLEHPVGYVVLEWPRFAEREGLLESRDTPEYRVRLLARAVLKPEIATVGVGDLERETSLLRPSLELGVEGVLEVVEASDGAGEHRLQLIEHAGQVDIGEPPEPRRVCEQPTVAPLEHPRLHLGVHIVKYVTQPAGEAGSLAVISTPTRRRNRGTRWWP